MDLALGLRLSDLGEYSDPSVAIGIAQQAFKRVMGLIDTHFQYHNDLNFSLKARTEIVDEFLNLAWTWSDLKYDLKKTLGPTSLIALGAYGRQRLYPNSPIEILVLLEKHPSQTCPALEHFLDFCWQSRLSLVHRIQAITHCEALFRELNFFSLCSDPRFIIGETTLFKTFLSAIEASFKQP